MAELPYSAVSRHVAPRGNWGCVSSLVNGNGGVWRRRPNPTGQTQAEDLVPGFRSPQSWARLTRLGLLRMPGGVPGHTGFAYALGGTVGGTADGGSGIDESVGNPAPSLRIAGGGVYARRLKVAAGAREVRVQALQPKDGRARPRIRVKANPAIGVTSDIVGTSASGAGWNQITVSLTASAAGGVWVILENPEPRLESSCWFDNLLAV